MDFEATFGRDPVPLTGVRGSTIERARDPHLDTILEVPGHGGSPGPFMERLGFVS